MTVPNCKKRYKLSVIRPDIEKSKCELTINFNYSNIMQNNTNCNGKKLNKLILCNCIIDLGVNYNIVLILIDLKDTKKYF